MTHCFVSSAALRLGLLASITTAILPAQNTAEFLARMDSFARTFNGAKANIHAVTHNVGLGEDDDIKEDGLFTMKRSGSKAQFRIDFTGPNAYSIVLGEQTAEIYHPKINEIQVYDIRAYKDLAQKFALLGFGMPGRELAANYELRNLKHDTISSQPVTFVQLVPKSPEVLKQLKSVDIWISDTNQCPVRQAFHFPDGGTRTVDFSNVQVNPKIPGDAFELPKGAKRVKVN